MLPLITRNPSRALLLLFSLLINLPCYTLSDCAPSQPTLEEQFGISPLVVRVEFDDSTTRDLPCGMEIHQEWRGYTIHNSSFPSYTVMEIFKQDWSEAAAVVDRGDDTDILKPGDTIPIILNTDTGFYRALPARLTEDPQGFLVFLLPYRYCLDVDEENELEVTPYPEDEFLLENPFLMNECVTVNQAWSTMMLEDQVFLRSQSNSSIIFIPGEGDNNAATEPPEEEENENESQADDYFTIERQDDDAEKEDEGSDSPMVNEAGNLVINGTASPSTSSSSSGIMDAEINEDDREEPVIDLEEDQNQGVTDSDTNDDEVNVDDEVSDPSSSDEPSGVTASSSSLALSTCLGLLLSFAHAFCSILLV